MHKNYFFKFCNKFSYHTYIDIDGYNVTVLVWVIVFAYIYAKLK